MALPVSLPGSSDASEKKKNSFTSFSFGKNFRSWPEVDVTSGCVGLAADVAG